MQRNQPYGNRFTRNRGGGTHDLHAEEEDIGRLLQPEDLSNIFAGIQLGTPANAGNFVWKPIMEVQPSVGNFSGDPMISGFQNMVLDSNIKDQLVQQNMENLKIAEETDLDTEMKMYSEEELLQENKELNEIYSVVSSVLKFNNREMMNLQVENQNVSMEVDSGAVVSVCPEKFYNKYFSHKKL
jgi:hypothetical protein